MSGPEDDSATTNGTSALLDDVLEEVANRLQAGGAVDFEAILTRYPEHAESLRRLLPAIAVMADFGVSASRPGGVGRICRIEPPVRRAGSAGRLPASSARWDAAGWGLSTRPSRCRWADGWP